MQKYDKYIRILAILVITLVSLYLMYELNGHKGAVLGYKHLIGLSLPNASVSHYTSLIQRVNENEDAVDDVNILVKEAQDNVGQQLKDIEELENYGIDLLVISPIKDEMIFNKLNSLKVPVIVLNEKQALDYAEAFIGYDNQKAGELLAKSLTLDLKKEETVVLICGNKAETLSNEREDSILKHLTKEIREKTEKLYGDWKRNEAENQLMAYIVSGKKVNTVIALSDQMAYGAYLGTKKLRESNIRFFGLNGYSGEDQGLDLIKRNIIENTVQFEDMYQAMMKTALAILHGEDYEKETILRARLAK